jgi:hypothetical protein
VTFREKPSAFLGPFGQKTVPMAASTRMTPIDELPVPKQPEIPISELPLAGPLFGDEQVPLVQHGITCRVGASNISALGPNAFLNQIMTLIYVAAPGQQAFSLSTPDRSGRMFALTQNHALHVTVAGDRLIEDDGTGSGDYTIELQINSVVFVASSDEDTRWQPFRAPMIGGEVVVIDIFAVVDPTIDWLINTIKTEMLGPIVTENVIPDLTYEPNGQMTVLYVNGHPFFSATSPPDFTTTGRTIQWVHPVYSVGVGSQVEACYTYGTPPGVGSGAPSVGVGGLIDAPADGRWYARQNNAWMPSVGSVAGRSGAVVLDHNDITDWAVTLAPYALTADIIIPVGSTTLPKVEGRHAAIGVSPTWARADHVHPAARVWAEASQTLYYQAIAAQTAFPINTPDIFGQSLSAIFAGNEGVDVYLNGVKLAPWSATFSGDYIIDVATETVSLLQGAAAGAIIAISVTINPKDIAPVLVLTEKLATLPFDGVTTSFALLSLTGLAVTAGEVTDLHVVVDGVEQDPGIDFVLDQTGQFIEFIYPPEADAKSFIIYYAKSQIGFLSVVEHDWTMTGDGTTQNPLSVILASEDVPGLVNVPAGSALTLTIIPAAPPNLPEAALGLAVAQPVDIVNGTDDVFPVTSLTLRGVMGDDVANLNTTAKQVVPAMNELLSDIVDLENTKVDRAGDTMTGPLVIGIQPVSPGEVANKQYVDEAIAASALYQGVWHVASNSPDLTPSVMNPLNGWSWIAQTVDPNTPEIAPPALPGIGGMQIDSGDRVLWDAAAAAYDTVKGSSLSIQEARTLFVEIAGDTMTGPLVLFGDPPNPAMAANKNYVDNQDALRVAKTGDVMSGDLGFFAGSGLIFSDGSAVYKSTFGPLTLQEGNPSFQPQIADAYGMNGRDIIDTVNGDARYVNMTGDTMTGPLFLARDPQVDEEAATKTYVDETVADTMSFQGTWLVAANNPDLTPTIMTPRDGYTWICQTANPDVPEVAPAGLPGLSGQTIDAGWSVSWNATTFQYDLIRGPSLSMTTAQSLFVNKAGDTMTGNLAISANLTVTGTGVFAQPLFASGGLAVGGAAGANMNNGPITFVQDPVNPQDAATKNYVDLSKVAKAGDTMTGTLTLRGAAVNTGKLEFHAGQTVQTPEISFYTPEGTRRGYIGYGSANIMHIAAESGYNWRFDQPINGQITLQNGRIDLYQSGGMYYRWLDSTSANNPSPLPVLLAVNSIGQGTCGLYQMHDGYTGYGGSQGQMWLYNGNGGYGWNWFMHSNVGPSTTFNGTVYASVSPPSDSKLKSDITPVDFDEVDAAFKAFNPVRYKLKPPRERNPLSATGYTDRPMRDPGRRHWGLLADDVEIGAPDLVTLADYTQHLDFHGNPIENPEPNMVKAYDLAGVLSIAIAKIKQLEARVKELER